MKKNNALFNWVNSFLLLLLISFSVFLFFRKPDIAFVKTGIILEKYKGMIDARKALEKKAQVWESNIDTLKINFDKGAIEYDSIREKMSSQERKNAETILHQKRSVLEKYASEIELQAQVEEEKVTQGVLNQINSYIEQYAKSNGYDLIVGTTNNGSLLYGADKLDITSEVLEALNKNYYSEK